MKQALFAALLLTAVPPAYAQTYPYISPGLQIGYGFGQGLFVSAQVSAGIIFWEAAALAPAATIGIRKYKDQTMSYADVQFTLISVGFGVGRVWVTPDDGSGTMIGKRFKLYGGSLALGSYDFYKLPGHPIKRHLGLFLVFPFIFGGFSIAI